MHRGGSVTTRGLAGFALSPLALVPLAMAAAACLLLAGCSPGVDYPSLFPAVHDMPPPRAETTMDPAQVQQATEDLITARNHLSAETQGAGQAKTPANDPNDAAAKQREAAAKAKPAATGAAPAAPAAPAATQTAGADTKP